MTRELVLVGKIGPAFNGAEIRSYGMSTMGIDPEVWTDAVPIDDKRYVRDYTLDILVQSMAGNMSEHDAYRFDVATHDGMFR